jgi:hypothetical protein
MSFEDAVAELGNSIESDVSGDAPAQMPSTPAEQTTPSTTPEGETNPQVQPQFARDELGRFAPPPAAEPTADTFDGGKFNPDTLPPELQDGWKQLQAAFTQKTQEVAQQRQQLEQFGDLNQVAQAVQLFNTLQDPQALTQFHSELTQALQAQGLSPVHASAEAARQIEESQTAAPDADRLREEFPELAPFLENQQRLEQRISQFETQAQQRQEAEELAYTQMALAGELQRQEMAIRDANPAYKDQDVDAIYELSSFYDGNLLQAQQRYEQIVSSRIESYLAGKQSASATGGLGPAANAGTLSDQPEAPHTLAEAQKAAERYLIEAGIDSVA